MYQEQELEPKTMNSQKLLNMSLSLGSMDAFLTEITSLAELRAPAYVCVANAHMLVETIRDPQFRRVVNGANIVTPDGMPLVKALKWLYGITQERVAGMDLLPRLLEKAEKKGISVFFYGGSPALVELTQQHCRVYFPQLQIAGVYSPPFRKLTAREEEEMIQHIQASGAHLVFVVLGCPKQEKWMAQMSGHISATLVGIGGALPVLVGLQKRAPQWMQQNSLEWLYRLGQEPKRLFTRYFVTNSLFLFFLFRERIRLAWQRVFSL